MSTNKLPHSAPGRNRSARGATKQSTKTADPDDRLATDDSVDERLQLVNDQQRGPWTSIYGVHGLADNPKLSMLADPSKIGKSCRLNSECGGSDSLCVATQSGRVCGAACTDDSACPSGSKCSAVNSQTLGPIKQCLPG